MSLQIPIQKDIGEYQEKIVGKMSFRTLICVIGGFASAIAVAAIAHLGFGIDVANVTLPVMAAALPFWLAGFWRPYGMKLEEFAPLFINHHTKPQTMQYEPYTARFDLPESQTTPGHSKGKSKRAWKKKGAEFYEPTKQDQ